MEPSIGKQPSNWTFSFFRLRHQTFGPRVPVPVPAPVIRPVLPAAPVPARARRLRRVRAVAVLRHPVPVIRPVLPAAPVPARARRLRRVRAVAVLRHPAAVAQARARHHLPTAARHPCPRAAVPVAAPAPVALRAFLHAKLVSL